MSGGPMRRVLVVDDDRDIRELVGLACRGEGIEVRTASNGQEALATLRSWRADVVVLDLMMPVMDGWEFRERQLADPSLRATHVIVMSANRCLPSVEAVLRPCAMLAKPFDLGALLAAIDRCNAEPASAEHEPALALRAS